MPFIVYTDLCIYFYLAPTAMVTYSVFEFVISKLLSVSPNSSIFSEDIVSKLLSYANLIYSYYFYLILENCF